MSDALSAGVAQVQSRDELRSGILRRVSIALLAIVVVIAIAGSVIGYEVSNIRTTQLQTQPVLICLLQADNGIVRDVPLAFSGDKHAADYSRVAQCPAVPPLPKRTRG